MYFKFKLKTVGGAYKKFVKGSGTPTLRSHAIRVSEDLDVKDREGLEGQTYLSS